MKTQEDYDKEWSALAEKYYIGVRVLRHCVNTYKDKHKGEDYAEAMLKMRKDTEQKLIECMRSYRQIALDYSFRVAQEPKDLNHGIFLSNYLKDNVAQIAGYKDKIGYYKGIISFLKWFPPEKFKEAVEYKF